MYFLLFSIFNVLRIFEALQILFNKFLLKWGKLKKILRPAYSLNFKSIILLLNRGLIFFWNGHIRNVISTLLNVAKIDVENDNVVSAFSNVVQFNVKIHNSVPTLLNVVNISVGVRNVVSTLIWRCATSQRHINLKATLNRHWNVCWEITIFTLSELPNLILLKSGVYKKNS